MLHIAGDAMYCRTMSATWGRTTSRRKGLATSTHMHILYLGLTGYGSKKKSDPI